MTDEPSYAESKALLIERLLANGWTRTESSQSLGWANLVLDTAHAKLEVEHMSDWWMVNLILHADDGTGRVEVEAGERLERFLQLLTERQHDLSIDNWDAFVQELSAGACIPGCFSAFVLEYLSLIHI